MFVVSRAIFLCARFHCHVSISRILSFLLHFTVTLVVSHAFFFFLLYSSYVRISRIHSFLFFNIFSKYLAHSQLPPMIFYLKTFLHSDELREMQFSCNAMQKRGKTVHIIVNVVQIMIKSPNFFGDSKSWKENKTKQKQQTIKYCRSYLTRLSWPKARWHLQGVNFRLVSHASPFSSWDRLLR